MLFDDQFLDGLRTDPLEGALQVCARAIDAVDHGRNWDQEDYENLAEALALLEEMRSAGLLTLLSPVPTFSPKGNLAEKCKVAIQLIQGISNQISGQAEELRLEAHRKRFKASLGSGFVYEFSQGDLEKLQILINDLRATIAANTGLASEHKSRLLKRLEALQAELHKKISDLDKFFGLIGDAGVVLAKLGNDAKPIVDRVREIADIIWQTQSRAEELPSGTTLPQIGRKKPPPTEKSES